MADGGGDSGRRPAGEAAEEQGRARRQRRLALARRAGLLPVLERAAFWREAARPEVRLANAAFREAHPGLALPPLRWMHDMYAHASWPLYWSSGRAHAAVIAGLIEEALGPGRHAVCEWGCGMGRIVRHLTDRFEATGYDYNGAAVAWCARRLDGAYHRNGLMPPLPAGEGAFDAVYAVSVLTHLSAEAQAAWAAELARVLRPGGALIVTVHGDPAPGQLLPAERAAFDAGRPVTRGRVREGGRTYAAYHPEPYVRALLAGFTVLRGPEPGLGQTLYLLRRDEGS